MSKLDNVELGSDCQQSILGNRMHLSNGQVDEPYFHLNLLISFHYDHQASWIVLQSTVCSSCIESIKILSLTFPEWVLVPF
jgi:hypothetical protein